MTASGVHIGYSICSAPDWTAASRKVGAELWLKYVSTYLTHLAIQSEKTPNKLRHDFTVGDPIQNTCWCVDSFGP